jgi:hypothetical protein
MERRKKYFFSLFSSVLLLAIMNCRIDVYYLFEEDEMTNDVHIKIID